VENATLYLRRCLFDRCFTNTNSGGAISVVSKDCVANLVYCNFRDCAAIGYSAGAINIPSFESLNISRCCFTQCRSNVNAHIISACCDKKPVLIADTAFGECGSKNVSALNYFQRSDLRYTQTNTTYNFAKEGVFFSVSKPRQIILEHCFWVHNEGETCFTHPESVDLGKVETWDSNNVFFNSIQSVIVTGSIDASIMNFVMSGNTFKLFWSVDAGSTIHLVNGIFDFGPAKLNNLEGFDSKIDYREDTKFEIAGITPMKINVSEKNYCFAFEIKKPFAKGSIIRIQELGIVNHPHMTVILGLLFVSIILFVYYLLQRKTETRQGLMRNII
jgi:hypothetical protein